MRRTGFTLLEVIIALVILSLFAVVTLQMRLDGLRAGQKIAQTQQAQRALDDVLELAINQMLPNPVILRDDTGAIVRVVWRGERLGETYECVSETIQTPAPMLAAAANNNDADNHAAVSTVPVQRFTATVSGKTAFIYQPVRGRP